MDNAYTLDSIILSFFKPDLDKLNDESTFKECVNYVMNILNKIHQSTNLCNEFIVKSRLTSIVKNRKTLSKLLLIPLVEQRTQEWYDLRNTLITASDFGEALGCEKFGKKDAKRIYKKKCGYDTQIVYDNNCVTNKISGILFSNIKLFL